jgi:tetratricopeptide (TPR) repeat protein/predicted Ser/Thr protein kinase
MRLPDEQTRQAHPQRGDGDLPEEVLAPGAVVGRFIVHRMLGMGGAGVVYAAHDPDLDRTIALKILRPSLSDRDNARSRFLREAQALARLSHPNVISIYDVGSVDGHTFIAMEYIHGHTFADWLAISGRARPEILAVLIKAGRGLAAAHAADLIHRDFKPSNLLVGVDGKVVVTDFGLARTAADAETDAGPDAGRADRLPRASAFAKSITRTGAAQGTPAYMAPEQREGKPADARADQFSFCVTLHEALLREHPSRGVPAWLQRVIQRGLSGRPEDRHPSMDSLLVALSRAPFRRRRARLALAAAIAAVGGGVALALAVPDSREESCTGGGDQVVSMWNPGLAGQVRAAFAATGLPHAESSAQRIAARLDAYTGEWAGMFRSTCLATSRGEQSPDLLDRQMACLDRRLAQAGALVDLFVHRADGKLVDKALDLVANLEPLPACADAAALLARAAPPADPARRARVTELERQADRADLERQAGRAQAAADGARAVLEAERPLDYAPLAAQAGRVFGRALDDLGNPLEAREALVAAQRRAEAAGDIRLAAHLMLDLLIVVNVRQKRLSEAKLLVQLIEAVLGRPELRRDEELRVRLLAALGSMANDEGHADRAIEIQREALAIRRRISPPISSEVANAEQSLGNALRGKARYAEAREHFLKTLAIRGQLFGDQHPLIANVHINLGVTYIEEDGNAAEARTHFLAALAILERVPTYRSYPTLLSNLAALEQKVGNLDQSVRYHEAAIAAYQRQFGPDSPDMAISLKDLGNTRREMGALAEADALHRRALAIQEKVSGIDHPGYAMTLSEIGEDMRRAGRAAAALTYQQRALRILRARMGEHPTIGYSLVYEGLALLDLGRRRQAIPILTRGHEMVPAGDPDRARAALALARALEPRGPRSERAKALAQEALEIFTAVRAERERARAAAYLVSRRRLVSDRTRR